MALNLGPLKQAVDTLEDALRLHSEYASDPPLYVALRDAARHRFKLTYELAWKLMQRWLSDNVSPEAAESIYTRKELYRLTARHSLIGDPVRWFEYHRARNLSAHTYDEAKAEEVFEAAQGLAGDVRALLNELGRRND